MFLMSKKSEPSDNEGSKSNKGLFRKLNVILIIIIIILAGVLAVRYDIITFDNGDDNGNGTNGNNTPMDIPLPTKPIINTHEHIDVWGMLDKWLASQRQANVSSTIMVGSPNSTFWSKPKGPFIKYLENNELIIEMARKTNGEIIAFPTLDPNDKGNVDLLKDYLTRGAVGLNLWTGHHGTLEFSWGNTTLYDWLGPLNRTDMDPVYEYCQENRIPIIWSNNLGIREIRDNLWPILERFPDMVVKIPHFGIAFREYNLPFIESFLDNYTGLYTCFSWGHPDFVMEKFENISNDRNEPIREFFYKYQDRILFGTDIVPTDNARKTVEWMRRHTQVYVDVLEKDEYEVEIYNFTPDGKDFIAEYRGLGLPESILEKIYFTNTIKFLTGKRWNETLDEADITRFGGARGINSYEEESTDSEQKENDVANIGDSTLTNVLLISTTSIFLIALPSIRTKRRFLHIIN
jgi:predicted TIM-barrel fold metal-dependent hydrolase